MSFPPETPQDYCDYFQALALHAKPPDPKWELGLKASQLWRDYLEMDDVSIRNQALLPLVKILMPARNSGSLLSDLWGKILGHVAQLSINEQKEIWIEVFNVANQGEDQIKYNEEALEILKAWIELDRNAGTVPIDKSIMIEMVNEVYVYTFSGYDWIAFTAAIGEWFKRHVEKPLFYDLVCSRVEKKQS